MRPTTSPRLSGNHFEPTGVGAEYPNPLPTPTMTPKHTYRAVSDVAKLVSRNPALTRMLPSRAQIRGPFLSWSRPAAMNVKAKQTTAIVKVCDVCVRVQPNSFSSGATNTLQAYSDPSARWAAPPAPAIISSRPRLAAVDAYSAVSAGVR